jgi:heptosyltransferase-2
MNSSAKILVIQTAYLGDVILTIPVVQNIKKLVPQAEIDFICIPQTETVLRNNPDIRRLIVYDKRTGGKIGKLFRIISQVREQKYDIIICPHRSFRSALITHFSGAKIRIGFNKNSLSNLLTSRVYYNKESHEIERNLDLIRAIPQINFDESKKILQPALFPSKEDTEYVKALLHPLHSAVSFAPCSKWFTKQLSENKSVEIIMEMIKIGYRVILIGGSEDAEHCGKLEKHVSNGNLLNLCGKLTPLQSKVVIENSVCMISVDSAAAHVGASTDVPLVQIYGSTVPAFGFYPLKSQSALIENNLLTCRPCTNHGRISCPLKHFKCMEDIDAKKISDVVEKLVKK